MISIQERWRVIAETTANGMADATIEAWAKEAADRIDALEAERDELAGVVNTLQQKISEVHAAALTASEGEQNTKWKDLKRELEGEST